MTRRHISTSERLAIRNRDGICHICGEAIQIGELWDVEHVIPIEMGGSDEKGSDNLRPAHRQCHRTKTVVDSWQLAKAKRIEAKHKGASVKRSKLGHPTLKRKVSGKVVPR